jgi:putative NADH-flavin reductase
MKVALFGATGEIGGQILVDALDRGHTITASILEPAMPDKLVHERLTVVQGDVTDPQTVAKQVAAHDAVISAVGGWRLGDNSLCERAARTLVEGMRAARVQRLIIVGAAGTLEVAPGIQRMDSPGFPKELLEPAIDQRAALAYLRTWADDLDWTYFSPPALIEPGERRGNYRLGTERLIVDDEGKSRISIPDYSTALLDELESPKFIRQQFTAAY